MASTTDAAEKAAGSTPNTQQTTCTQGCSQGVKIVITVQRLYNYYDLGMPGTLEAKLVPPGTVKVTGRTTEQPPGTRDLGNGKKAYPIAAGTYKAYYRDRTSARNGSLKQPYTHDAIELIDVKGTDGKSFAGVQIHTGQWPSHSKGCIILATTSNGDEKIANGKLMEDSVPKNEELLEFVASTQAEYGKANVDIEVVVKDPPAGAEPPAKPEPKPAAAPKKKKK